MSDAISTLTADAAKIDAAASTAKTEANAVIAFVKANPRLVSIVVIIIIVGVVGLDYIL
ncbi:MAG: hypothetical protein ACHP7P_13580 [Terriglobales bacterium]